MHNAIAKVPVPRNEPVFTYEPGSAERRMVQAQLDTMLGAEVEVPMYIGGEEVFTDNRVAIRPPHDHQHILGYHSRGNAAHVQQAIAAALNARQEWEDTSWEHRASVFLKAADLISGPYRAELNAATMLGQSKNIHQAEIDAVAELVDFLRFNVHYMRKIYTEQPQSAPGMWNRIEYRPLEGFIFCITPFNFTAIAGNLPTAAAMMGNVCVWKPADSQILAAHTTMKIFREAGLPDGVINLIYTEGPEAGEVIFNHRDFAGLHFTGSTAVFQQLWKIMGDNISRYKSYPRIVGETGGKDYIVAHKTANPIQVATAISRGAYEFQGQKCSAASRAYISESIYDEVMDRVKTDIASFKMGDPKDFSNFINAVIDERAFDKISNYIDQAQQSPDAEIIVGGTYDKSTGYYISPTVIVTEDPKFVTMREEIFGPVLTVYKFSDDQFEETLTLVDETSPYALTGAIFAKDRYTIQHATHRLRHTAGNFYINDKPTGSVVGQQPFGGARGSGTNDKAGSYLNLLRWVSARTIKETFVASSDYRYPFLTND